MENYFQDKMKPNILILMHYMELGGAESLPIRYVFKHYSIKIID